MATFTANNRALTGASATVYVPTAQMWCKPSTIKYKMRAPSLATGSTVVWVVEGTPDVLGTRAPQAVVVASIEVVARF